MLFILFNLISAALAQTFTFPDGFVPPPVKDCETVMNPQDCWGPSFSTGNICLWDAADGQCSEQSHEDMESTCMMFMEPSSCRSRKYCEWNSSDLKCDAHGQTTEYDYPDLHYVDCSKQSKASCNDYGGYGTECNWHSVTSTCVRGYAGNFDFYCQSFDAVECGDVGTCMYGATGCLSRMSHPGGIPTHGGQGFPTLQKTHDGPSLNEQLVDYRFGALMLVGLIIGLLTGSAIAYSCTKRSTTIEPVPLITPGRQV